MAKVAAIIRKSKKIIHQLVYRYPKNVHCNICGWQGKQFFDTGWHKKIQCPKCNAQIRQRMFWAAVHNDEMPELLNLLRNKDILHFAPEEKLGRLIKESCHQYKTADLQSEEITYSHIDYAVDVSSMPSVQDNSFDLVLLFDVLEHVPDHKAALQEVKRVLRKGGTLITTVPQDDSLDKTIEDIELTDRQKRQELFGDPNHVRIYGDDFQSFLSAAAFDVRMIDAKSFSRELNDKFVLEPPIKSSKKFATNNRRIYFAGLK